MRVALLKNLKSGRGEAAHAVADVVHALEHAGHTVESHAVGHGISPDVIESIVRSAEAVILAGGDGTIHHSLPILMLTRVPMLQFPLGTENLFSREFAMTRSPKSIVAAIDRGRRRAVDIGLCDNRPFSLMMSVGFDAGVVRRVAKARTSTVRRSDYVVHGLHELNSHSASRLSISRRPRIVIRILAWYGWSGSMCPQVIP